MPSAVPSPRKRNPGNLPWNPMSVPPVSTSAMPRKSSIDPSVTTNGCTPRRAITRPWATPITSDDSSPASDRGDDADVQVHGEVAGGHRGDADHRADRQVDAAGDDHHRLAEREQRDQRDVPDVVAQVLGAEEERIERGGDERERDQHREHRQLFFHRRKGGARRARHFFSSRSSAQNVCKLSLLTVVMPVSMVAGGVLPSRMSLSAFIDW